MSTNKGKLVYRCEIPVRWGDMDAYGHVNNAVYMRYMEEARVQMIEKMDLAMDPSGHAPVIISVGCTFIKPVVYPDTLKVDCYAKDPGRSSFMTEYEIYSQTSADEPVSVGYAKVVWIDHRSEKSVELPEKVRAFIA